MTTKQCTIKLLNKSYEIKCPDGEEVNLHLAAKKINDEIVQTRKKYKQLDDYQALLLSALHISHELLLCRHEQETQRQNMNQFISSLEQKINKAVAGEPV